MADESTFPTLKDARDKLSELIERGFADYPVQILIVPDSTLQAVAKDSAPAEANYDNEKKPALMIEFDGGFLMTSTDGLSGKQMPTRKVQ